MMSGGLGADDGAVFDNRGADAGELPGSITFSIGSLTSDEDIYSDGDAGQTSIPMQAIPSINKRIRNAQPETSLEEVNAMPEGMETTTEGIKTAAEEIENIAHHGPETNAEIANNNVNDARLLDSGATVEPALPEETHTTKATLDDDVTNSKSSDNID
jgi:hypothetical protein